MRPSIRRFVSLLLCLGLLAGVTPAQAQSGNTWQIYYYNNPNWQGAPVYSQYADYVNFNWGSDTAPGPNMPAQYWSARMTTTAYFYAGMYRFQIQADDDFALYIDSALYADTRGANQPGKAFTIDVPLAQGNHYVDIEYRQYSGPAYIYVNWSYFKDGNTNPYPPSPPVPPPPPSGGVNQLFPPPATLVTEFGDYTSCAQQQIHQKNCFQSNGAWNAPNAGSIESEPQIIRWQQCTPDSVQSIQLYVNQPAQSAKCSKTGAGWFPN